METRYRKPVSTTDSHIVLRASIKEVKRNIVIIEAKLYNKDGEVCTEAVLYVLYVLARKVER